MLQVALIPIMLYADDTLVLVKADTKQLFCLKALLNTFASAIGLKVNYNKSNMVPINLNEDRIEILINTMGCKRGVFPFTYLGLPLGLTKPSVEQCLPLVQKTAKMLMGLATFMTQVGRLLLVKSILASLPKKFMCCLDLPETIKLQIAKYLRHCLWRGSDLEDHIPAMVAWSVVCRPKNQGGLGVYNLNVQNKALLLKNLHKVYNRHNIPLVNLVWETYYSNGQLPGQQMVGSFWWKANLKLVELYKSLAKCNIGDGKSAYLWTDQWHLSCLHHCLPHLFSFTKNPFIFVETAINMEFLEDLFHLPLSLQAYEEFQQLEVICEEIKSFEFRDCNDTWSYIKGSERFSSSKAYTSMIGVKVVPPHFQWVWNSSCQPKHKVFFWMVLHDRVNTRNLLRRKTFHLDSYNCAVINCQQEETLFHLFWGCPFSAFCWDYVCPNKATAMSVLEAIGDVKNKIALPFAMDIIILAIWAIWITRNNLIFQ